MKNRVRVTLWILVVLLGITVACGYWFSPKKSLCQIVKSIATQYTCHQRLQTYLEQQRNQGSTLSIALLTAQFFFNYDADKTPGPYVFINLAGSNDPNIANHPQFINAAGIFGPTLPLSACTDLTRASTYYNQSSKSAYAHNMLALIYFQQGDTQKALQHIHLAAQLVNDDFPATDLYSNRYQGLRTLAWLVINATNDQEHYLASQQLVDSVSFNEIKPYGTTLVDRIPLLTLYMDSLANVARIRLHGTNGISKNVAMAQHYLQRYWKICQNKKFSIACDTDLLKYYQPIGKQS